MYSASQCARRRGLAEGPALAGGERPARTAAISAGKMAQRPSEPVAIPKTPGYDRRCGAKRPKEKGHAAPRRGRVLGGNAIGVVGKGGIAA